MEEVLQRIILVNQAMIAQKRVIKRNVQLSGTGHIKVLTGIRRCGKTCLLYELAQRFDPRQVLFLDFEDERLLFLNGLESYDIITDAYSMLFPGITPVLFFDEIQNLNNWHLFLKRLYIKGLEIFVTGSNAHMISREIATYLKGISLETTLYPFSFSEFLELKEVTTGAHDQIGRPAEIQRLFREYMEFGGFPEVIRASADDKRLIARNIFNLLFYKDMVTRYGKEEYLLRLLVSKIAENITKEFSVTSLARKINPVYRTSVPTVTEYFNLLPEPYLTFNLLPFRSSFVQRESKRKTYFADNAFIFLNRIAPDHSRLFENLIFIELLRNHRELFYYRIQGNGEADFYVPEKGLLIQACYTLDAEDTYSREKKSLMKALAELGLRKGYIYTWNDAAKTEVLPDGKEIEILPFWKTLNLKTNN